MNVGLLHSFPAPNAIPGLLVGLSGIFRCVPVMEHDNYVISSSPMFISSGTLGDYTKVRTIVDNNLWRWMKFISQYPTPSQ